MIKSLVRTLKGPSRDPRMAYICRPMPRDLPDEQVVAALEIALAASANPDDLVETLPPALRQVTGRTFSVLDRSTGDVTGAFRRSQVMIRDGEVGLWPGYAARAYPLLAPSESSEKTRAAIIAADATGATGAAGAAGATDGASPTNPAGKPGWAPPPPVDRSDKSA